MEWKNLELHDVWPSVFSPMIIMKQMYPYQIYGLATYALRKTTRHEMGEAQYGV
jgi:hypothetical protein